MNNFFRQMKLILTIYPIVVAVLLAGCGGGGSATPAAPASTGGTITTSATISGSVVKGPVIGATVSFFALNADGSKGAQLGTTTTDPNGNYTVTLTPVPTTPILVETSGGKYVDEATGATTTLATTDKLQAVLPAGTTRATVTPLTHIAAARAQALAAGGTPLATAVDSSNMGVASQYGIANIITTLPPAANNANSVATANRDERIYALVLAGIAQQASYGGVRSIDLAQALAEDAKDGLFDGKNGATAISIATITGTSVALPATTATSDMQMGIDLFIASPNNKTNLTQVKIPVTSVQIGVNSAGSLYPTLPVLPYVRSGESISATLTATGGTPPYTCNLKAGSVLPAGFALGPMCQITGTAGFVANDTIFAPFVITLTDSATPANTIDFAPLYLTALRPGPVLGTPLTPTISAGGSFTVTATGGVSPYHFKFDTFLNGTPPLGATVDLFTGKVTIPATAKAGTYTFGICVVDIGGRESCQTNTVTVNPAAPAPAPTPTAGVSQFNGTYKASATRALATGDIIYIFAFTLTDGAITGSSLPGNLNSGSVSESGVITGNGWCGNGTFIGQITLTASGGATATGTVAWQLGFGCAGDTSTWTATRQ